jgi:hypothetical protein
MAFAPLANSLIRLTSEWQLGRPAMLEIPSSAPMMAAMSSSLGALNASPLDILGTGDFDGYNLDDGSRKLGEQ